MICRSMCPGTQIPLLLRSRWKERVPVLPTTIDRPQDRIRCTTTQSASNSTILESPICVTSLQSLCPLADTKRKARQCVSVHVANKKLRSRSISPNTKHITLTIPNNANNNQRRYVLSKCHLDGISCLGGQRSQLLFPGP